MLPTRSTSGSYSGQFYGRKNLQADFNPVTAMNFSLEHQNPLVTGGITGLRDSYPGPTFSLLNTGDPNVLLWSLKPSEEGMKEGLIARFWNFNTRSVTPAITVARPIRRAWQTTRIETNERLLKPANRTLSVRFAPNQLNSYRLQLAN